MPSIKPTFSLIELANEIWKPVVGWESFYDISNLGRIRNRQSGQILNGCYTKKRGEHVICLYADGTRKRVYIHRVVMAAFVGYRPSTHDNEVNHIDGNPSNNRLENLEYVTRQENMNHAARIGLIPKGDNIPYERRARGERQGKSKISVETIIEIRNRWANGIRQSQLAKDFNLAKSHIARIVKGKSWAHLPLTTQTVTVEKHVSKITRAQVQEIRELYATGDYPQRKLAQKFGISQPQIAKIITGQRWRV